MEQAEPFQKELIQTEKELSMLAGRKNQLFELYEDGLIAREEFLEQKDILNIQIQRLEEDKNRSKDKLADGDTLVSYERIQQTLQRFGENMGHYIHTCLAITMTVQLKRGNKRIWRGILGVLLFGGLCSLIHTVGISLFIVCFGMAF